MLKSSVDPLYLSVKEYLCCTLSREMGDLLAAWTAAGALGLALAALSSARLAQHALSLRKQRVRACCADPALCGAWRCHGAACCRCWFERGGGVRFVRQRARGGLPSNAAPAQSGVPSAGLLQGAQRLLTCSPPPRPPCLLLPCTAQRRAMAAAAAAYTQHWQEPTYPAVQRGGIGAVAGNVAAAAGSEVMEAKAPSSAGFKTPQLALAGSPQHSHEPEPDSFAAQAVSDEEAGPPTPPPPPGGQD